MKWLNWIERKIGRHYIPNLMRYIVFGMLGVFILEYLPLQRSAWEFLYFNKTLILRGEVWRLITWIFLPPTGSILFILLNLYFYYFLGTSLENHWGSARFNIYYAIGILGNILAGFLTGFTTNSFLEHFSAAVLCRAVPGYGIHPVFLPAGEGSLDRLGLGAVSDLSVGHGTLDIQGVAGAVHAALRAVLREAGLASGQNGLPQAHALDQSAQMIITNNKQSRFYTCGSGSIHFI